MLRTYYHWRYSRKERRPNYTFHNRDNENFGPAFGHYLSQHSAHADASNPVERRKRFKWWGRSILAVLGISLTAWLIIQVFYSLQFF